MRRATPCAHRRKPALRNAISHFNIEFIGDGPGQIRTMQLWNKDRTGSKTWDADLGLRELRGISDRFIDLLLEQSRHAVSHPTGADE